MCRVFFSKPSNAAAPRAPPPLEAAIVQTIVQARQTGMRLWSLAGLDEWWAEVRRQRDLWRRVRRGLKRRVEEQRQQGERQREAMRSVVVQAQVVAAEAARRTFTSRSNVTTTRSDCA